MSDYEKRVRELAYQIWESEGKPEGQRERHWQMACELMETSQDGELSPAAPKPTAQNRARKVNPAPKADETQLEKPALLGKPKAARKPANKAPASETQTAVSPKSKPTAKPPTKTARKTGKSATPKTAAAQKDKP
ncbi:Protein of unknown function [Halopseudomonas sabulinigri]|uniref:DUF2934 domain-containing protein n=1 Tax=Halopseudomonas sabulinigri TaxID=472181 RepID=A0A1H1PC02_9GAMM|nr:DUF2934 domain-containing protein [Halopseudomonas sabulinigri]SDS08654.1 Protein of unknown function [Halopseudomonas sabulinigri]